MKWLSPFLLISMMIFSSCSIHIYHHGKHHGDKSKCSKHKKEKCDEKKCPYKSHKDHSDQASENGDSAKSPSN